MSAPDRSLGVVTEGSYAGGLTVRLAPGCPTEALRVGSFVVLEGDHHRYFSLITDMRLRVTDPALAADPPDAGSAFLRRAIAGVQTYATVEVRPSLMLENAGEIVGEPRPGPVRNIPMHFATLREANAIDFDLVFGQESQERFSLGTPLTMNIPIPIDIKELVTRSNGIFGQSGTGKSVLTRLLLFGIMRSDAASVLLFDMHNEYTHAPPGEPKLAGVVELFGESRVKVYTLDKGVGASRDLIIGLDQIEPGDVELLSQELNLTDTFPTIAHHLVSRFRGHWLKRLLDMDAEEFAAFCADTGAHPSAVQAAQSKLARLRDRGYIAERAESTALDDIMRHLQRGNHVVLRFGRYQSPLDWMLVANIVTRRIHERYTDHALRFESGDRSAAEPRRLVVVLEEAHKFLTPEAARQSIFGTIAREMRKYSVTLLVVDQRPSSIDPEILSQLGTRITGLLTDARDIDAVLTGVADRNQLRAMLASLRPRQECLVVGHAIPMPIMLRTRDYDGDELRALPRATSGYGDNGVLSLSRIFAEEDE